MSDSALVAPTAGADSLGIDDLLGCPSALEKRLPATFFPSLAGDTCERAELSLRDLAGAIERTSAPTKDRLPLLKLATFGESKSAKGSLRHSENLERVHGIEGDHDAGTLSIADARSKLSKAGVAGLIYSTPSHRSESPRWRVLVPLSQPVAPAEREALTAALNGVLDGALAPESFAAAQAFFYGKVQGAAPIEVALAEGAPIDLCTGHMSGAIGRDGKPYSPRTMTPEPAPIDDEFHREPEWGRIKSALAKIPAEDFDADYPGWIRIGAALHHEARGSAEGLAVFDEWSCGGLKYDARAVRDKWESFSRKPGGVGIGSLFEVAKGYGWEPRASEPVATSRLQVLTPSDCDRLHNPDYVVKGLIRPRDLFCIYGAPGTGKSLIAPHIGYAVAQGREAFGMRVKPGPVLYVAAEDAHGMRGRVKALRRRHGDAEDFKLVDGVNDLLSEDSGDLAALRELAATLKPKIIFIDTLAAGFPGLEENDAAAMGRVVALSNTLTETGAAVCLVHHDTKAGTPTPRGHSLFNGALHCALQLTPADQGVTKGKLSKNKNGPMDRLIAFSIATENLGIDEDGDSIIAPLVQEVSAAALPSKVDLKPSEQAALARLMMMLEVSGAAVTQAEFQKACIDDPKVSAAEERDARRRVAARSIQGLVRLGRIVIRDGFVSLPSDGFDDWESA